MKDKQESIRDKMNLPDSLMAGIVYEKEVAWDKLQTRLDKKPARKMLPYYWLAAAACITILIMIAINNRDGVKLVHTGNKQPATPLRKDHVRAVAAQPENIVSSRTAILIHAPQYTIKRAAKPEQQRNITAPHNDVPKMPVSMSGNNNVANTVLYSAMPVATLQKMKVVQINEIADEPVSIPPPKEELTLFHNHYTMTATAAVATYNQGQGPFHNSRKPNYNIEN